VLEEKSRVSTEGGGIYTVSMGDSNDDRDKSMCLTVAGGARRIWIETDKC